MEVVGSGPDLIRAASRRGAGFGSREVPIRLTKRNSLSLPTSSMILFGNWSAQNGAAAEIAVPFLRRVSFGSLISPKIIALSSDMAEACCGDSLNRDLTVTNRQGRLNCRPKFAQIRFKDRIQPIGENARSPRTSDLETPYPAELGPMLRVPWFVAQACLRDFQSG